MRCRFTLNYVARIVSRAGAEKLLQHRIQWPSHADVTPWFIPDLRTYVASSDCPTFYQTWTTSANTGHRYPRYDLNIKLLRVGPLELMVGDFAVLLVVAAVSKLLLRKRVLF